MAANTDKFRKTYGNFSTTLSNDETDSSTTIELASATGLPTDTAVTLIIDRVDSDGDEKDSSDWELVTGVISGNNLTNALRGEGGTSASSHSAGAVVEAVVDEESWNDAMAGILVEHSQDGTHGDITVDSIDMQAGELVLDDDGDTSITADTDDQIDFRIGGSDLYVMKAGAFELSKAADITIADTGNDVGLTVTQNDTTNNPKAASITNAGTGSGLYIDQTGVLASSKYALWVYSNAVQNASSLAFIEQDNSSSDQNTLSIQNDGTGDGLFINQNGDGVALNIDSEAAAGTPGIYVSKASAADTEYLEMAGGVSNSYKFRRSGTTNHLELFVGSGAARELHFSTASGEGKMSIKANNGTFLGDVDITGALSKGSGSFNIPHPDPNKPKGTRLRHSFVESPTAGDNIYRYQVEVKNGKVEIELPDYFKHLNENPQAWVSPVNVLGVARAECTLEKVMIEATKDGEYNVLVIGTRKDEVAVKNWEKGLEYIK